MFKAATTREWVMKAVVIANRINAFLPSAVCKDTGELISTVIENCMELVKEGILEVKYEAECPNCYASVLFLDQPESRTVDYCPFCEQEEIEFEPENYLIRFVFNKSSDEYVKYLGKKIYLAGFDVFHPDAIERGNKLKELCRGYQYVGLYPLDNELEVDIGCTKAETAKAIFDGNIELIEQCDIVLANLNPFRSPELDAGTCFECGYAHAKGKPIYGYLDYPGTLLERLRLTDPGVKLNSDKRWVDSNGYAIENFDLPINLMLGVPVSIINGTVKDALEAISDAQQREVDLCQKL